MVQLPPIANAASSILGQVVQAAESRNVAKDPQKTITDIISGEAGKTQSPRTLPHAKLSEQLFSLDQKSVAKLKMQLFEKVGKALGVDINEYPKFSDFVQEVEAAYLRVLRESGPLAIKAIERETGLDELGLSLRDIIDSMKDPEKNDKVTQALIEKHGLKDLDDGKSAEGLSSLWV